MRSHGPALPPRATRAFGPRGRGRSLGTARPRAARPLLLLCSSRSLLLRVPPPGPSSSRLGLAAPPPRELDVWAAPAQRGRSLRPPHGEHARRPGHRLPARQPATFAPARRRRRRPDRARRALRRLGQRCAPAGRREPRSWRCWPRTSRRVRRWRKRKVRASPAGAPRSALLSCSPRIGAFLTGTVGGTGPSLLGPTSPRRLRRGDHGRGQRAAG